MMFSQEYDNAICVGGPCKHIPECLGLDDMDLFLFCEAPMRAGSGPLWSRSSESFACLVRRLLRASGLTYLMHGVAWSEAQRFPS